MFMDQLSLIYFFYSTFSKKSSPLYYLMTKFFFFLFIVLVLQYDYVFCIILLQFILFFRAIYFSCKINFVSSTFSFYKYLNIFERVGDLCVNCFFWFSQSFFFTAFLNMNIKIVAKGNRTKTCVFNISQNLSKHKSFDVIITKYTLSVLFAFTV